MTAPIAVEHGLDWDVFVEKYWDREPVLIKQPSPEPFTYREAFDAACAASTTSNPGVVLTVDGVVRDLDETILPRPEDGGFRAFADRMRDGHPDVAYSLVISGFHSYSVQQWRREQDFLRPLWERVGQPISGAITTLFHGPYRATPVGVHRDRFATFMYLIEGRKRMRFWREKPWTEDVSSVQHYEHLLDSSFVVEPEIGDLLYWPADYYHVGEGADEHDATSVNIGVPRVEHEIRYDVERLVVDLTTDTLMNIGPTSRIGMPPVQEPLAVPPPAADGAVDEVPAALRGAYEQLVSSVLSQRVHEASQHMWTAGGLEPMPPGADSTS